MSSIRPYTTIYIQRPIDYSAATNGNYQENDNNNASPSGEGTGGTLRKRKYDWSENMDEHFLYRGITQQQQQFHHNPSCEGEISHT